MNYSELSERFAAVSDLDLPENVKGSFSALADVQRQADELRSARNKVDLAPLIFCVDEWCRVLGSAKSAFNARVKALEYMKQTQSNLMRKQEALEKLENAKQSRSDKLSAIQPEIEDAERTALIARKELDDVTEVLSEELARLEEERICDFVASVRSCIRNYLSYQSSIVKVWESFLAKA